MSINPPRLLGTYSAPLVHVGQIVRCEIRGEVEVVRLSSGPILWPIGRTHPGSRQRFLIVMGGLAEAIRRESAEAVGYWWGVAPCTTWVWRKALGVGAVTEGTHLLRSEHAQSDAVVAGRQKAHERSRDPEQDRERRRKIGEAHRGKPRRPEDIAPAHEANRGRKASEEQRRRMSESRKGKKVKPKPPRPPLKRPRWTAEQGEAVRTLPPVEAAKRTGRTLSAVMNRRFVLRVNPAGGQPSGTGRAGTR